MKRIKEILSRIGKGTTVDALVRELNMNESLLRAMIKFLVDRGYLREINTRYNCMNCLLGTECSTECYKSLTKMYTLASKRWEFTSSCK